jgi:hypothetical protein
MEAMDRRNPINQPKKDLTGFKNLSPYFCAKLRGFNYANAKVRHFNSKNGGKNDKKGQHPVSREKCFRLSQEEGGWNDPQNRFYR